MPGTLTAASVADLLAIRCPGWVPESVVFVGEGDFCSAYLVDGGWVFRFAKHEKAAASLLRETCMLPRIADRFDVRIPSPRIVSAEDRPAFIAYPVLPGPALTRERYLRLAEPDRERCARQLARFLAQMHATDPALARECGIEAIDYRAHYEGVLDRAQRHLFAKLAEPERSFVERELAAYLSSDQPSAFRPALLHGDVSPDHVLYDESAGSISAVIDFGDMVIGDPAWDLVFIYEDYGLDFLARLLPAYTRDDPRPLLDRMYRLYVLDMVEWVARCAEDASPELADAVAALSCVRAGRDQEFREMLSACGAV